MASHSINEDSSLINQQINLQEDLNICLAKAEALAHVALGQEFFDYPEAVTHYYLCALSDIIEQARKMNEQALNMLFEKCELGLSKIILP